MIGYCLKDFKTSFSSKFGTLVHLSRRLFEIIEAVTKQPCLLQGEVPNLYSSKDADYLAEVSNQITLWKIQKAEELAATSELRLDDFGIKLAKPWHMVRIEKWPKVVAEVCCKLTVGTMFTAIVGSCDARQYRAVGLMWNPSKKDYRFYYYPFIAADICDVGASITHLDDTRVKYVLMDNIGSDTFRLI